jgi:hypothetical protein
VALLRVNPVKGNPVKGHGGGSITGISEGKINREKSREINNAL